MARKLLRQLRPAQADTPLEIYRTPKDLSIGDISLIICNTTSTRRSFSVYVLDGGTGGWGGENAVFKDSLIGGNETIQMDSFVDLSEVNGISTIAVEVDSIDAVTFTLFGNEGKDALR